MKNLRIRQYQKSTSSNLFRISVYLFVLALLILLFSLNISPFTIGQHGLGTYFEVSVITLGIVLLTIILIWNRHRGYFDLFELPVWISISVYFQVLFPVLLNPDFKIVIPWLNTSNNRLWGDTVVLFAVGLLSMWLGYFIVFRFLPRTAKPENNPKTRILRPKIAFVVWGVGTLLSILAAVSGSQGYLSINSGFIWENYLAIIQFLGWAAWSSLMFHYLSKPSCFGSFWILFSLATHITIGFILGTKSVILWFVYVIMHIFYLKRKISLRWVFAAFFLAIIFVPLINQTRYGLETINSGKGVSLEQRIAVITDSITKVSKISTGSLVDQTYTTISNRQTNLFQISASVLSIHPSKISYVGNDIAMNLMTRIIPRFLWPNKPTGRSAIYDVNKLYYGVNVMGLAAIGLFADIYRTGGWFVVVVFFIGFGGGLAWLYSQGPARGSNYGTVFYLTMLVWIILFERDASSLMLFTFEHGILIYLFVKHMLFRPILWGLKK
ncbi:MAG: hypothetical protein NTZ74_02915 [Chloroflexi bacterium]|nr:hypothetical protein [Chloroflexota bacterium]